MTIVCDKCGADLWRASVIGNVIPVPHEFLDRPVLCKSCKMAYNELKSDWFKDDKIKKKR